MNIVASRSPGADHPSLVLPSFVLKPGELSAGALAHRAGGTLAILHGVLAPEQGVPLPLLASRLALRAAVASLRLEGRTRTETDLRDAFHFTRPGDALGPDGDALAFWRAAIGPKASPKTPVLEADVDPSEALTLGQTIAAQSGPLAGCVALIQHYLDIAPRAEREACRLSDILLARLVGWPLPFPVTALYLTKSVLRDAQTSDAGALKLQARLLDSLIDLHRLARDFARRAAAAQAMSRKLRAKTSDPALAVFLREEAVVPVPMLSPRIAGTKTPMTDRAARRFCDRLVSLGVATELTGRSSFRLYGLAP